MPQAQAQHRSELIQGPGWDESQPQVHEGHGRGSMHAEGVEMHAGKGETQADKRAALPSKDSTQAKTGHKRTRQCTHRGIGKSRAGANAGSERGQRRCALCASRQRVAGGMACTMCAAQEVMSRMQSQVECVTWASWLHSHTHHRKKVSSSSA